MRLHIEIVRWLVGYPMACGPVRDLAAEIREATTTTG